MHKWADLTLKAHEQNVTERVDGLSTSLGLSTSRLKLPDALRAFALFGILQINIQSYLWGVGDPLGFMYPAPRLIDSAAYWFASTFIATKFLSLFALLFGFGFVLQLRKLRQTGLTESQARAAYQHRLQFLLLLGVAHGCLLYHGDVLTAYALAGFVLLLHANARASELARACRNYWCAYAVITLIFVLLSALPTQPPANHVELSDVPLNALTHFSVMAQGSYGQQLPLRVQDYLSMLPTVLLTLPWVLGLFTLGALAARLGWLTRPQRHRRLWRRAHWLGWLALPAAAAGAWLNYEAALDRPALGSALGYLFTTLGGGLVLLYLALLLRWREQALIKTLIDWLAPAGRMPLTNYLMQSLLMGLLLSGWGLQLGLYLQRAELALLALAIVLLQLMLSRWWLSYFHQGPVEACWRRVTYWST